MTLQPLDFGLIEALVLQKTGLKIDRARHGEITRTLGGIMHSAGLAHFRDLIKMLSELETTDPVWRQIVSMVTIGETYFFRDAAQCRALQTSILPDLIQKRRAAGFHHLSLWSAGCATGEEPYTLAILLRELIPDIETWTFNFIATDINHASLDAARKGSYKARAFRDETRSDVQARWFTLHNGVFELNPAVRKMVDFAPLNLISDDYPTFESRTMNLDLIICRNVTIYFEEAATRQIMEHFHCALNEDGWLVAGHAEPITSYHHGFAPRNFPNAVIYQKQPVNAAQRPLTETLAAYFVKPTADVKAPEPEPLPALPEVKPAPAAAPVEVDPMLAARTASGQEDWKSVQRWLDIAERATPLNPEIHYLRGLMRQNQGDGDGALQAWRRAIYCDASFVMAHYVLGELYEKRRNFQDARRCWQHGLRAIEGRNPDDVPVPGEDLTVDMLRELLTFRISMLPGEPKL